MKTLIALLCFLATPLYAVTLEWDSPDPPDGVVGYKIHWGTIPGIPIIHRDAGPALTFTVDDAELVTGETVYFVATAYNSLGQESVYSNEVAYMKPFPVPSPTPNPTPYPPRGLRIHLAVINGKGDGRYHVGTLVTVKANKAPPRYSFSRWIGDYVILANPFLAVTTATIPSKDVVIQADYVRNLAR